MPSELIQRQLDRLLAEAAEAIGHSDWEQVRDRARNILRLDPDNADALSLLAAADRDPSGSATPGATAEAVGSSELAMVPDPLATAHPPASGASVLPTAFDSGRYTVKRFLGEGGKKRVYLAHDNMLDRDVAFALIKTEGLDDVGRNRIRREAQAMGRLG